MKKILLLAAAVMVACGCYSQTKKIWTKANQVDQGKIVNLRVGSLPDHQYELNLIALKQQLIGAPDREKLLNRREVILEFPTPDGTFERFRVMEASVLHPDLAAKYPSIKSYAGQGVDDPAAAIRFSVSDERGFHGMVLSDGDHSFYIDPYTSDLKNYVVYTRNEMTDSDIAFQCLTAAEKMIQSQVDIGNGRTNDKKLRRYRLALSCNAEYGNIFAGTGTDAQKRARILAQMNITMTRVNGIYERDLSITMQIIPNNDLIIYFGSTSADPWSGEYNTKTQQVIDAAIGNANYDIGHNFNTSGGGNAGCIGCVCTTGTKGRGYTGRPNPTGDAFDIDYVAHEMGHQFGANHTQASVNCISGDGTTEVEPGSGSTIMGYAGICTPNVQNNSDAYFAYVSIKQISENVQTGVSSACPQVVNLSNNPPTANAGLDYIIPKSTAFVLTGQGTDIDGDSLMYTWEQNDPQNELTANSATPTATQTAGPVFRSRQGTSSPKRYFPALSDVIANNLSPTWEVIPSVARQLNFSLTVRDNKAGGGQTSDDLMLVTVNAASGPFVITAPSTAGISWSVASSQIVTWNVANTNVAPVSCANVNILLSTDGGLSYPVTLASNTANDGTETIVVPNSVSATCRIKVEAANNIFYDISNANFTIIGTCTATVPTGLAASSVTSSSAILNWNAVPGASYDVQYRVVGAATWTVVAAASNTFSLSGLSASTAYEAQVRSKCASANSAFSASVNFTTPVVAIVYCASKGNSVADEYINRVQLGTINNTSGSNGGYRNYTALSTSLAVGSSNTITITPAWTGSSFNEGYAVWIDYNKDGDFVDAGELVWSKSASKTTPVSGTFTVPAATATGSTVMRVSMKYNGIPSSCEMFSFGEVEDYTVVFTTGGGSCNNVTLTLVFDNYPEETSWTIKNSGGTTIASGGTYGSAGDGSTLTATSCLPTGCYTFTMNDAFGDGMCCSFGNGSYVLKDASGTTLASGGSFSSSTAHAICVGGATKSGRGEVYVENDVRRYVYPNPVKDVLSIQVPELTSIRSIHIVTPTGMLKQSIEPHLRQINVGHLSPGLYVLFIETNTGRIAEKFIKE
jgi:hypothetical protein